MSLKEAINIMRPLFLTAAKKVDAYLPIPSAAPLIDEKEVLIKKSPEELSDFLKNLTLDVCYKVCARFKKALPQCIQSAKEIEQLLQPLDASRRNAVYEGLYKHVPHLVKSAADFELISRHLITVHRVQLYQQLQEAKSWPTPDSRDDLLALLKPLPSIFYLKIIGSLQSKWSTLFADQRALDVILAKLNLIQGHTLCLTLADQLPLYIQTDVSLKMVLEVLNLSERFALYSQLGKKLVQVGFSSMPGILFEDLAALEIKLPALYAMLKVEVEKSSVSEEKRLAFRIIWSMESTSLEDHHPSLCAVARLYTDDNACKIFVERLITLAISFDQLLFIVEHLEEKHCSGLLRLALEKKKQKKIFNYHSNEIEIEVLILALAIQLQDVKLVKQYKEAAETDYLKQTLLTFAIKKGNLEVISSLQSSSKNEEKEQKNGRQLSGFKVMSNESDDEDENEMTLEKESKGSQEDREAVLPDFDSLEQMLSVSHEGDFWQGLLSSDEAVKEEAKKLKKSLFFEESQLFKPEKPSLNLKQGSGP